MPLTVPASMIEHTAAKLWMHDNPDMSVFECTKEMQELYRERVRIVLREFGMEVE